MRVAPPSVRPPPLLFKLQSRELQWLCASSFEKNSELPESTQFFFVRREMGCVSSTFLDRDDEFTQIGGSSGIGHHFVSLTSTTYGLLTIDPPPPPPRTDLNPPTPPRFGGLVSSLFSSPLSETRSIRSEPEVINSWELMAGLDSESSRFSPTNPQQPKPPSASLLNTVAELDSRIARSPRLFMIKENTTKENSNPNRPVQTAINKPFINSNSLTPRPSSCSSVRYYSLDQFEKLCPPGGENRVVIYTTTLRGVRKTFEACNGVRAAIEGMGVVMSERDVSMDRGFREELKVLMKGKEKKGGLIPLPRVFINGRYIGGEEEVLRIHEEGCLGELVEGIPKSKIGVICEGCGGIRFLPCFQCNGSCKILMVVKEEKEVVMRCPDCNENGLVQCPICM